MTHMTIMTGEDRRRKWRRAEREQIGGGICAGCGGRAGSQAIRCGEQPDLHLASAGGRQCSAQAREFCTCHLDRAAATIGLDCAALVAT
jgi:hypothetical protein